MCVLNIRLKCLGSVKSAAAAVRDRCGVVAQVVLAEALVAVQALDQRVGEPGDVAARLPDLRGHDDRGLQPDDVVAELDHRTPPATADVAAQLDPERAVVPRRTQPAVDLAGLEDDPPALGQGRDGLHEVGHVSSSFSRPLAAAAGVVLQATGRPWRTVGMSRGGTPGRALRRWLARVVLGDLAETPRPLLEVADRLVQLLAVEVRPEHRREPQLAVRRLPQKEVEMRSSPLVRMSRSGSGMSAVVQRGSRSTRR